MKKKGIVRYLYDRYKQWGIRTKLMVFYTGLLILSLSLSALLYHRFYTHVLLEKVGDVSSQTLQSISTNINNLFSTMNNYSRIILANENVQHLLRSTTGYSDPVAGRKVNRFMRELMSNFSEISSIYLFDNAGHKYVMKRASETLELVDFGHDASWYQKALNLKGAYYIGINGDGAFKEPELSNGISCIRVINDLDTQLPIGALIVNVSTDYLINTYSDIARDHGTLIILKDKKGGDIIKKGVRMPQEWLRGFENNEMVGDYYNVISIESKRHLISSICIDDVSWRIFSVIPFDVISGDIQALRLIALLAILISAFLIYLGTVFVSRMITRPIDIFTGSMSGNTLKTIDFTSDIHEFESLRDRYNMMIGEIQELIERIKQEQKIKRKAELDVLQAQIKPHFLYNTLGSVNALIMGKENDKAYNLIEALGTFYRISLSKGREVITLKEEIDVVKNYLTIQQIRYEDMFSVRYDIDDTLLECTILKLVLQPLVENALYHGIKLKGEPGVITITARKYAENMELIVEDDGLGMRQPDIDRLLTAHENPDGTESFGLAGTIRRLQIFYSYHDILSIRSQRGKGTAIIIHIPLPANTPQAFHE